MQIDKQQIIAKLTELGHQDKAARVDNDLNDQIDTDQHPGPLEKHGTTISDLLGGTAVGTVGRLGL